MFVSSTLLITPTGIRTLGELENKCIGSSEVCRIITDYGYSIICSPNILLKTEEGFKKISDLTLYDRMLIKLNLNLFPINNQQLSTIYSDFFNHKLHKCKICGLERKEIKKHILTHGMNIEGYCDKFSVSFHSLTPQYSLHHIPKNNNLMHLKEFIVPNVMNENLAKVLGYLTAINNIYILKNHSYVRTIFNRKDFFDDYKHSFDKCFPNMHHVKLRSPRFRKYIPVYRHDVDECRYLVRYLFNIGVSADIYDRKIPRSILCSTKESLIAFIRAYLNIHMKILSGGIEILFPNKTIALEFHTVFSNVGVLTAYTFTREDSKYRKLGYKHMIRIEPKYCSKFLLAFYGNTQPTDIFRNERIPTIEEIPLGIKQVDFIPKRYKLYDTTETIVNNFIRG